MCGPSAPRLDTHPPQHLRQDWRQTSAGTQMGIVMGPGVILWTQRPRLTTVLYSAVVSEDFPLARFQISPP